MNISICSIHGIVTDILCVVGIHGEAACGICTELCALCFLNGIATSLERSIDNE